MNNFLRKLKRFRGRINQWTKRYSIEKLHIAFVFDDQELKEQAVIRLMGRFRRFPRKLLGMYDFTDEELTTITSLPAEKAKKEIHDLVIAVHDNSAYDRTFIERHIGTIINILVACSIAYNLYLCI